MNNSTYTQELFEKIERYILQQMSLDERKRFEERIAAEPELRRHVEEQQETTSTVQTGAFKESLENIHLDNFGETQPKSGTKWWAIAAGIAAIVAVSLWVFNLESTEDELFAEYSTTDPGLPVPMSATDTYEFHDAMVDYKAGKYQVAIGKWETLLTRNSKNDTLNYYIGAAFFNDTQYEKSLGYFTKSQQSQSEFRYKSQWYQLLAQLKLGKTDKVVSTEPLAGSPYTNSIDAIKKALRK